MKSKILFSILTISILTIFTLLSFFIIRFLDLNYKYDKYENKTPKVSVVVPVYNAEKTIGQTLECLTKQTLKDIEIICINDGSKDKSLKILKQWAKKHNNIRIYSQKNKGAGAARNRGLDLANGKYIIFLDADDLFKYNMLEKLYTKAEKTKSDIVISDYSEISDGNNNLEKINTYKMLNTSITSKEVFNYKDVPEKIFRFTYFQNWNKLLNREFINKNSIKHQEIRYFEDLDFVYSSLVIANRISLIDEQLILHRNLKTTKTLSKYGKKYKNYFYNSFSKLQQSIKEKSNWNLLKQSYTNFLIEAFFVEYNNTKKEYSNIKLQKEIIKNNTDNMVNILQSLGIENLKPEYFYVPNNYIKLRAILVLYGIQI